MKRLLLLLSVFAFTFSNAQTGLLDGTGYAPDFTVIDVNGTSHTLYNYLDSGKVVVLEFLSVTCGHCQQHAAGTENSYIANGPSGSNVARFLGLEVNASTNNTAVANFATTYGASFPIANNVSPTAINYQLYYTPGYFVIYPDRSYTTICAAYCVTAQNYTTIEGLLNAAISSWIPPIYGCTDPLAVNYDSTATIDNDSCDYTSYIITTIGMSFTPDTIICDVGDTINFILGGYHNAVEVSDSTWLTGGTTSNGGFSFGFGSTGMFIPDDCHTFYYVCQPHASSGMKGVIIAHHPPVFGCTDSIATNYNPLATIDDGSCCISSIFQQIGGDIDGENAEDNSGSGLAISSDGNIIAIGAVGASIPNYPNFRTGHVRIYENNGGTWTQLGGDIDGEGGGPSGSTGADYSGESVALSSNGNIVAIGARFNDGNGSNSGHVRVYERDTNNLSPQGPCTHTFNMYDSWGDGWNGSAVDLTINGVTVISGATVPSGSFNSVTFSANNGDIIGLTNWITGLWTMDVSWTITDGNGSVIAAGDHGEAGNCIGNCMPIMGWTQIGQDIDGENAGDQSGSGLSISSDGTIVAIGTGYANGINGNNSGHVRVFENNSGTWIQIGQDIDGEAADDYSGNLIELSSDGNIVAIGATGNDGNGNGSGHVRIYENNNGSWIQIGQDIDGEAAGHGVYSVSINSDGSIVAIGSTNANQITNSSWCNIASNSCMTGHVRVFENNNGTWIQVGQNIEGEEAQDYFGSRVSLSGDGLTIAIGAFGNDGNGPPGISGANYGHVRIYENNNGVWNLINEIDGESAEDHSGFGLALSDGGNIVAIGARDNDATGNDAGHVRVYGSHCTSIVYGCTDSLATNYDPIATVDDGSCTYISVCGDITGVNLTDVIHDRAIFNWDDMNQGSCVVDQIRIRYRVVGTSAYSTKTMGAPVGNNAPCLNTSKLVLNLISSTTYEYDFKIWYQDGTIVNWHENGTFTTSPVCDNAINVTATPITTTKTQFCWDSVSTYAFVRLKYRENVTGSSFSNIGGFGVFSPTLCKDKNGLAPGTQYRVMWRTWCNPNGGPYRSPVWDGPVIWDQPTSIRVENTDVEEIHLIRITDLLGREVNPDKVIDQTTLFYIYSDGSVEKKIKID